MSLPAALLFDMDGTLVDNMPFHERTWLAMLADGGVEIGPDEFHRRAAGRTNPDILREFFGDRLTSDERNRWAERKEARYREEYAPHLRALDGLDQFLAAAHRLGIPLALATSGNAPNIEFVLEGLGIRDLFDATVSGDEVRRGKPDPEMFLTAAERLGVAPQGCIVFEDSLAGVEAARRAGMRTVVLATGPTPLDVAGRPDVLRVVPNYLGLDPRELLPAPSP